MARQATTVCGVCQESPEDPIQAGCKHIFCRDCIGRYLASASTDAVDCPVCFRCVLPADESSLESRKRELTRGHALLK